VLHLRMDDLNNNLTNLIIGDFPGIFK